MSTESATHVIVDKLPATASRAHVIVDKLPQTSPDTLALMGLHVAEIAVVVSVITLVCVLLQIYIAKRTLEVTNVELELTEKALTTATKELSLAEAQLREAQKASEQTRLALQYTHEQIELGRRDAITRRKESAPHVVADVRLDEGRQERVLWVSNKGGVALYVAISCIGPDSTQHARAGNILQILGRGEERATAISWPVTAQIVYAKKVRIRYADPYDARYITEYQSLNETLQYPIYREPWLGKEYGYERPANCSDRVSWAVEPYERLMTEPGGAIESDEPIDEKALTATAP